ALRALAGATALSAFALPAQAQQIDRIVAFGDSYADTGNAFALGYANPNAQIIYRTGRFSGGTNYIDTLANLLGVPVDNYAIGGALASINNTLICFDPVYGAPLCGDGFQYEVDQFLGIGPQSPVFPVSDTTLDESDLVAISIGGNDARLYQQTGGSLAVAPLAGAGTAALATVQLDRIVGTGTPTISFIAGDTGRLPEIAGDPTGAAVRSAFSASFNAAMQQTLAGYAADGSIVHYLDLSLVLDNIAANPTAYGITKGLACPALPNLTCLGDSSGYLFYLDGLHLTSQGFAIVGQYVATQLRGPLTLQAPADLGVDSARQFGRTLDSRLLLGMPVADSPITGLRLYAVGDAMTHHVGISRGNDSFRNTSAGLTIGADYGFGPGAFGLAARLSRPKSNFGNSAAEVRTRTGQVGAYAGTSFGGGFIKGFVGYGWDDNKINRTGVVENMAASPRGNHWLAGAKAGYLMPMGGVAIGPVVALDYAKAKVKGYTEDGDPALTLNVSSQSFRSLRGSIGAEVHADLGESGAYLQPYLSAMAEKELGNDGRSIVFSQTSASVIVNTFDFEPVSKRIYARLNAGGATRLSKALSVDAGVSMTFGKKRGNETSGQLAVSLKF
ncbi:MAG: autotransporter domain-containing protein, partial [Pseudomonadota bacterium]